MSYRLAKQTQPISNCSKTFNSNQLQVKLHSKWHNYLYFFPVLSSQIFCKLVKSLKVFNNCVRAHVCFISTENFIPFSVPFSPGTASKGLNQKKKVYMLVGSTNTWKYKHQLFHKKFHWQPLNSVSILKFSLHCYFKVEIIAIIV